MEPLNIPQTLSPWTPGIISLVNFVLAVGGMMGVMLFLTAWLGEKGKNPDRSKQDAGTQTEVRSGWVKKLSALTGGITRQKKGPCIPQGPLPILA